MAQLSPVGGSVGNCIVVWLDAREAMIVTWQDGRTHLERVVSDVPAHHRSTGHVRHVAPGSPGAGPPRSAGEGHRLEHLRRYVENVAEKVTEGERPRRSAVAAADRVAAGGRGAPTGGRRAGARHCRHIPLDLRPADDGRRPALWPRRVARKRRSARPPHGPGEEVEE